jgi:flagellar hook-basal body complex protein FliE
MDPIQQAALRDAAEAALAGGNERPGVAEAGKGFGRLFESLMGGTAEMQQEARQAVDGMLTGEVTDIHQVMVAVNKAELSFRFLVEIRNKLTEAYKELMMNAR